MKRLLGDWRVLAGALMCVLALVAAGVALAPQPDRPPVPLSASQMPGFELVRQRDTAWHTAQGEHTMPEQVWRHTASGATLDVQLGTFTSAKAARAACEAEVASTQAIAQPGTFSGAPLGDFAWHWPAGQAAARIVLCRGRYAVSVHMVGQPLPQDAPAISEAVARRVLEGMGKGR